MAALVAPLIPLRKRKSRALADTPNAGASGQACSGE